MRLVFAKFMLWCLQFFCGVGPQKPAHEQTPRRQLIQIRKAKQTNYVTPVLLTVALLYVFIQGIACGDTKRRRGRIDLNYTIIHMLFNYQVVAQLKTGVKNSAIAVVEEV
jgi:CHASE2 domain-containing sensor protein